MTLNFSSSFFFLVESIDFVDNNQGSGSGVDLEINSALINANSSKTFCFSYEIYAPLGGSFGDLGFNANIIPLDASLTPTNIMNPIQYDGSQYLSGTVNLSDVIGNGIINECAACSQSDCDDGGIANSLEELSIDGTFIIDQDYCFYGAAFNGLFKEIHMRDNAKIIVKSGATLRIRDAIIKSCSGNLWDRIEVEPGGTLFVTNSTIEKGRNAIWATGDATLAFAGNTFLNNETSIVVPAAGNNAANNVNLLYMYGNTFDSNSEFIGASDKPRAGISISDQIEEWFIGGSPSTTNIFSRLERGINVRRSNLTSSNNKFIGISKSGSGIGIGIYAQGQASGNYNVNVISASSEIFDRADFEECENGVVANDINLFVNKCSFRNNIQAITFRNAQNKNASITENNVVCNSSQLQRGIGISINNVLNGPSASVRIEDNIVGMYLAKEGENGNDGVGIALEGCLFYPASNDPNGPASIAEASVVQNNLIDVFDAAKVGILTRTVRNGFIQENTINLGDKPRYFGIYAASGFNNEYSCNLVEKSNASPQGTDAVGLILASTTAMTVATNEMDKVERGVWIVNDNQDAIIEQNKFIDNTFGLQYGDDTGSGTFVFTGEQPHRLNIWETHCEDCNYASGELGAVHYGTTPELDEYKVDFSDDNVLEPSRNIIDWFKNIDNPENPSLDFFCEGEGVGSDCDIKGRIIAGDFPVLEETAYKKSATWSMRKRMTEKHREEETPNCQEVEQYLNSSTNESFVKAYALEEEIKTTIAAEDYPEEVAVMQGANTQMSSNYASLATLYDDLAATMDNQGNTDQVLLDIADLKADIRLEFDQRASADLVLSTQLKNTVEGLYQIYDSELAGDELYLVNQRAVNRAHYQILLSDTESEAKDALVNNQIERIANSCSLTGGDAVFQARSLMASLYPGLLYLDADLCGRDGRPSERNELAVVQEQFSINPNPASSRLKVTLTPDFLEDQASVFYQLFDVTGRELQTGNFTSLNNSISLSGITSGLYFLKISNLQATQSQSFLIQ